jgi:hypothetical protein
VALANEDAGVVDRLGQAELHDLRSNARRLESRMTTSTPCKAQR